LKVEVLIIGGIFYAVPSSRGIRTNLSLDKASTVKDHAFKALITVGNIPPRD